MIYMKRLRRVAGFSKAVIGIALLTLLPSLRAEANRWDPEGAARAFEDARRMQAELSNAALPILSQYLECARTYRKVHVRDPHYSRTGDAIYEEGLVYQEMGDKFASTDFYRTAVKRFELLIKDYGGNQNCPDALLRMGDIHLMRLNDEAAAQKAYRLLRANYGSSSASRQLAARGSMPPSPVRPTVAAPPASPPAMTEASPAVKAGPADTAVVQSIRHWSTSEYTRVIIDLDSKAIYSEERLFNPDRIYFDISGAKLSSQLGSRTLSVEDALLKQVRISQKNPGTVRVVLDLSTAGDHSVTEMRDPFRIVVDLHRPGMANVPVRPPQPESPRPQTEAVQNRAGSSAEPSSKPKSSQPLEAASQGTGQKQPPRAITGIQSIPQVTPKPAPAVSAQVSEEKNPLSKPAAKDNHEDQPSAAPVSKQPAVPEPGAESKEIKPPPAAQSSPVPVKTAPVVSESRAATAKVSGDPKAAPSGNSRPAAPTSLGDRTLTRMLGLKIGRIVIDPGHGGHDLGTAGPGGLLEKDLVLAIALDLKDLLEQKLGAQVVLTRSDDTFISLEERSALANRFRADLFLSIHANSSRNRSTSGVETYYLNFARTNAEREIASRENATSASNISELEDLIKKIALADKSTESKELASIIQKRLYSGVRKMIPSAQDRGVRTAPFIVLIGAAMPSVLTEVSFISNPRDERLLKKSTNQERLVKALFSGIESYMKTLGSDMAQNQMRMD
jgi:N-acetylmuramoyl-L-alanine amidase